MNWEEDNKYWIEVTKKIACAIDEFVVVEDDGVVELNGRYTLTELETVIRMVREAARDKPQ